MVQYWTDRAKISLKTDLVLELVDGLTNKLIQPCRLKFYINERPARTTKNKNGLMIFCNLSDTPRKLRIDSDIYQSISMSLSDEEISSHQNGAFIHRLIRMEPSRLYAIPKWATVVEGTVQLEGAHSAEDVFESVVSEVSDVFRVRRDSDDNSHVAIHMTNTDIMIGRQFYDSEKHVSDAFRIIKKNEDGYTVEPKLGNPLEAHSSLQEIKTLHLEDNGHFLAVFPKITGESAAMKLYKNKEKIAELQIKTGKWNDVGMINFQK